MRVEKAAPKGGFRSHIIKQIKAIAYEEEKTNQELAIEAFNLLFAKYKKAQIA